MPDFDKDWFDIVSFFTREGKPDEIGVHAFKMPYNCEQFFIKVEDMASPTFWADLHKKALQAWNEKGCATEPACARCGKTNWLRWYEGHAFCGWCGLPYPDAKDDHLRRIRIK